MVNQNQIFDKTLFKDCTVLFVNPPIEKAVEADRVLFLDSEGSLLQFDQPFKLLVNQITDNKIKEAADDDRKSTSFAKYVGSRSNSDELFILAKKAYWS